ncbi:MAG: MarR family transcriptional regulator [Bacteroidetes bacterium]|nr:MarR family transcriptional regulator [Bacteroidota bacterium]
MLNALQKLVGKKLDINTYDLVLLQAKSNRALKNKFGEVLDEHKLTTLDWSVLGILSTYNDGCRFNTIAQELSVEPPFVTELVTKLAKQKLISIKDDIKDRRAKLIILSKKGEEIIQNTEAKLQEHFSELFKNISASEFDTFKSTLQKISGIAA